MPLEDLHSPKTIQEIIETVNGIVGENYAIDQSILPLIPTKAAKSK